MSLADCLFFFRDLFVHTCSCSWAPQLGEGQTIKLRASEISGRSVRSTRRNINVYTVSLLLGNITSFSMASVCATRLMLDMVTRSCQVFLWMLQQALHCHVFSVAQYFFYFLFFSDKTVSVGIQKNCIFIKSKRKSLELVLFGSHF